MNWKLLILATLLGLILNWVSSQQPKGGDPYRPVQEAPTTTGPLLASKMDKSWNTDWQKALVSSASRSKLLLAIVTPESPPYEEHKDLEVVYLDSDALSVTDEDPTPKTNAQRFKEAGIETPCWLLFRVESTQSGLSPRLLSTLDPSQPLLPQIEEKK